MRPTFGVFLAHRRMQTHNTNACTRMKHTPEVIHTRMARMGRKVRVTERRGEEEGEGCSSTCFFKILSKFNYFASNSSFSFADMMKKEQKKCLMNQIFCLASIEGIDQEVKYGEKRN